MTEDTLSKANRLKSVINSTEKYLRDIKHYEHNLFSYNLQIVIPRSVGTFGTANKLYFDDKQLKKRHSKHN